MAIGLALVIQAFVVKPYQIPSESMEPTLDVGQRVLVNRVNYHLSDPDRGDIVVFHPPQGADTNQCGAKRTNDGATDDDEATYDPSTQACPLPTDKESETNFIKRVVAVPGDTLSVEDGHPVVNGEIQDDEDFIKPCGDSSSCNLKAEITMPPDHYFMMGDNRGSSDDSRYWGPVPRDWIIGQAFFTYWPVDRIGLL